MTANSTAMAIATTMPGPIAHPRFSPLVLPLVVKLPSAKPAIPQIASWPSDTIPP